MSIVEVPQREIVEEGAAAFILPGAGHRGDAERGMHLRRAVAAAGEAVAEPEEAALGLADGACERLDLGDRHAANRRRPFRRARRKMRLELAGTVGIFSHVGAIGKTFAEQHMHHAAGERAVGARPQDDLDVGLLHRVVVVDVDRRDARAALLLGARGMGHHVDLGVDGVGAPDHHEIADAHLARIDAGDLAGADGKADAGDVGADGGVEARVFLGVGEAIDAVAHHDAHRAGVVIRPDRLGAELALALIEARGDLVQRLVPGDARELAGAFRSGAAQRIQQPLGMMDALGVARDLGADDAGRIGLLLRAAHPADAAAVEHLDVERAGRRAVVRTGGVTDVDLRRDPGVLVHAKTVTSIGGTAECIYPAIPMRIRKGTRLCAQIGPAIGVDRLPRDVARGGTAEEPHHGGDILRSCRACRRWCCA